MAEGLPSGMENASVPKAGGSTPGNAPGKGSPGSMDENGTQEEKVGEEGTKGAEEEGGDAGKSGESDELLKKKGKGQGKIKGEDVMKAGNAAVHGAQAGMQAMKLAKLMFMLQSMGQAVTAAAAAAGNALWSALQTAWGGITGFFSGAVSAVSSFLSVGSTAASLMVAGGTGASVMVVVGLVVSLVTGSSTVRMDDNNCREEVEDMKEAIVVDGSAAREANAKAVYSVLKKVGLADENIAGVLGNWDAESGVDFTGVEGVIGTEQYTIGPRKQEAMDNDFDINKCKIDGMIASEWYQMKYHYSGPSYIGIGIGGWTAGNNRKLLAWADAVGYDWWTAECQLSNIIAPEENGGYRSSWLLNWEPESNPRDAAYSFADKWEGNTVEAQDRRKDFAEQWFVTIKSWDVDADYANSIINMAGAVASNASDKAAKNAIDDCDGAKMDQDNSTLAKACLSLAWPTRPEAFANDGVPLYQALHKQILPGDGIFQSCDRSTCIAVRWAGLDDQYPAGGCETIIKHLDASPKWEEIYWNNDESKLKPGDIVIQPDHVRIYLGRETVLSKYPDDDGRYIYEGSINYDDLSQGFSPHLNYGPVGSIYRAFRSVYREPEPKYKHLSASTNGTETTR